MFSHAFIGTSDFTRAFAFYETVMAALGHALRFSDPSKPWAGWQPADQPRPLLLIGKPFDGQPHAAGNGQMLALSAGDRATVDRVHALALAHGGTSEGAPALRPEYHPHYYAAYVRDPEGNKLCVVCHEG